MPVPVPGPVSPGTAAPAGRDPRPEGRENPAPGPGPAAPPPWTLEVSWQLPRAGQWRVRAAGVGSRVYLHLAVPPQALAALAARGWSDEGLQRLLRHLLAAAGFDPAGTSIRSAGPGKPCG
ncbi:hypothetical protein JCM13210_18610 [Thermaerobacter litoralis]